MAIKVFNTLNRELVDFQPSEKGRVKLYTCGPTVYNHAHIGNLRAYIFGDIVKRALEFNGYDVDWVMNITDIEDKIIASTIKESGSKATVADLENFTDKYFQLFLADLKKINIDQQDISFVKVTEKVADIQLYVLELIKRGFAYKADDGSTYFSIEKYQQKFGDYGALVGEKFLEGKKIGARVAVDEYEKENLADFALWKARSANDAEIFWDHPELGPGRPGWHIECTLINYFKFPSGTDIHTGGVDLIFPHHTNEIAQALPIYHPFVNYWLHSEHLLVDNKKMAKRAGNFYTLADLEKENIASGISLRYLILQSHYRSRFNVTKDSMAAAKQGLKNLREEISSIKNSAGSSIDGKLDQDFINKFLDAINNDFNTPEAMAVLQSVTKSNLVAQDKLATIFRMDEVLGLNLEAWLEQSSQVNSATAEIIKKRAAARQQKDYATSDKLRKELESMGYSVKDGQSPDDQIIIKN